VDYVLITHAVKDYAAWKQVFDDAAPMRKSAGEQRYFVLRHEDDANRIVHFSQWASIDRARSFFESPELVEIRRLAGVESPEFSYLRSLEEGVL
jgi:quinol monooxygenase YgiN